MRSHESRPASQPPLETAKLRDPNRAVPGLERHADDVDDSRGRPSFAWLKVKLQRQLSFLVREYRRSRFGHGVCVREGKGKERPEAWLSWETTKAEVWVHGSLLQHRHGLQVASALGGCFAGARVAARRQTPAVKLLSS